MSTHKIAVYGGSFNPPTKAHVSIAKKLLSDNIVDEVIVLPSYTHRNKGDQAGSFIHRMNMCSLAFRDSSITVSSADSLACNIGHEWWGEEGVGSALYLVNTLKKLRHTSEEYHLIIGEDNLKDIENWYASKELLKQVKLVVAPREGESEADSKKTLFKYLASDKTTLLQHTFSGSSTEARQILAKKDMDPQDKNET